MTKRKAKIKPTVSKFVESIQLPKFVDERMDRENKREFANYLQDKMKDLEVSIKFGEKLSSGGAIFNPTKNQYGTYNPELIPFDDLQIMRKDSQVAAGLAFIKMPIIAQNYSIFSQDPVQKAFVGQTIRPLYRGMIRSVLTAIDFGFAPHEKVFERKNVTIMNEGPDSSIRTKILYKGDAVVYKKIKSVNPDTISIVLDKHGNFYGIKQNIVSTPNGKTTQIGTDKSMIFTNEFEFGNYYGRTRLEAAYPMWYYKILMLQFMMRYFERKGAPPLVIKAPPGYSEDYTGERQNNLSIALELGKQLVSNTVGVLPYTESKSGKQNQWGADYLMDDKRGDQFIEVLNHLDARILRGLLIPERTITQDVSTGSFSMAEAHANIFFLSEDALIGDIEHTINEQIIPQLRDYNFPGKVPCHLVIDRIQLERKRMLHGLLITIINKMDTFIKNFGKAPFDVFPSLNKMAEDLGLPTEKIRLYDFGEKNTKKQKNNEIDDEKTQKNKKNDKLDYNNNTVEELLDEIQKLPVPIAK